jgi:hypothetical protein
VNRKGQAERVTNGVPIGPRVNKVLGLAYRARRPVLLEGPTGIGKSEIVQQLAADLGIAYLVLDLSLLEPPDLVGLPINHEGQTVYAHPAFLPLEGAGILMLEELNRAERYIQQPALQLLTARRLHQYELPSGWSTCAAINPEDENYQVTPLDPALRARFLNLRVRADRAAWLDWARENGIHPAVLDLARNHDDIFDECPPRTWTYVSQALLTTSPEEIEDEVFLRDLIGGYLPQAWTEVLLDALEQAPVDIGIDIDALLLEYDREGALQKQVRSLCVDGRTDRLRLLSRRLLTVLEGPTLSALIGRNAFRIGAFEKLLADLPGDLAEQLQEAFGENPASAEMLDVRPDDILKGYAGSQVQKKVAGWANDRTKRHRVDSLVTALCNGLRRPKDLPRLRKDNAARIGLGLFLSQLAPRQAEPLIATLKRISLTVIPPRRARTVHP